MASELLSRALALQQANDFAAAEACYRRFLSTHPTHLLALNNAALVAKALGRREVALIRLAKAVRHHPDAAEAHFNLANTLQDLDRLDEAIPHYRRAIVLRPGYHKACLNLGNALHKLRRYEEAAGWFQKALDFGGDDAETNANLGRCLKEHGRLREALVHFIVASQLAPERAEFHYLVGVARYELREIQKAMSAFRRVLELAPEHDGARNAMLFQAQLACDWSEVETLAPLVRAATDKALALGMPCAEGPFDTVTRDADPARNFAVAVANARKIAVPQPLYRPPARRPKPGDKIRLGYLSYDFRDHPVAQVFGGVFARHDRERFAVTAYSYGIDDASACRKRIEADCDRFVDLCRVPDDEAARAIRDDGINILVDLTGWTHGNRPRICALRPAAVQVQYLGFPGSSGAPYFDYAIVDRVVVPPEQRDFWSERLVFMPQTYFVADRDQPILDTGLKRGDCCLPEDGVVFCSFNQSYKIEPIVFGAWMRILAQTPGSVLWLSSHNDAVADNLRREAERRGIAASRLVFAAKLRDKAHHLDRLSLADLALDTLAYNGHTTTSDALWSGVPVVAVLGRHFASRVSGSLLRAIGLEGLIATDVEGYVRIALDLAHGPEERAHLRAHLATVRHVAPLFDTDRTVADFERAYERIWAGFLAGTPPADIRL